MPGGAPKPGGSAGGIGRGPGGSGKPGGTKAPARSDNSRITVR
jgi:hypothetical protein